MIDVSIIIVNWNTEKLLLDCIDSIIKQTKKPNYEIIIVDNASRDNSVQVVNQKYPDVEIIQNSENLGFSKANNQGIAISKGRYVCLMNSDVIVLENSIDILYQHIEDNKSIGVIVPMTVDRNYKIRENCRRFPNLWNIFCETLFLHRVFPTSLVFHGRAIPTNRYHNLYEVESISGCFMLVSKEAIEEVGMLDEAFFFYTEDVDWCKRFHNAGWEIIYLASVKSIHLGGESSAISPEAYQVIMENSDLIYWKKHHNIFAVLIYKTLRVVKCSISIIFLKISNIFILQERNVAKVTGFKARINFLIKGQKNGK